VTTSPHILIVEDDREISRLVARFLGSHGCRVSIAGNGREMDRMLDANRLDLVVLDLMLPGEDGLSICRRLRAASRIPIIMLTARGDELDRIIGLEMGADDYLAKPFNPRELLARIKAVLRRGAPAAAAPTGVDARVLTFHGWRVDRVLRELRSPDGARITLTSAEFDLLQAFCEWPGRILSRDQLLDLTHGRNTGSFERSIDVLVSRLRRKIERDPHHPEIIKTVRSGGYLFTAPVATAEAA
jgi:two-component system OmpR family response regulator